MNNVTMSCVMAAGFLAVISPIASAQSPNRFEIGQINPDAGQKTRTVSMETGGRTRELRVEDPAPITQAHVSRASVATEKINVTSGEKPETKGISVIRVNFNREGRKALADLNEKSKGRLLAIIVDGRCIATPKVAEPITRGELTLSGNFTPDEAKTLAAAIQEAAKAK